MLWLPCCSCVDNLDGGLQARCCKTGAAWIKFCSNAAAGQPACCSIAWLLVSWLCITLRSINSTHAVQGYEEAGTDLAQVLSKKETISTQKAAMSPDIAKALAKLANGLYVVTAAHSNQVHAHQQ